MPETVKRDRLVEACARPQFPPSYHRTRNGAALVCNHAPLPPDTPTIANAVGDLYATLAESEARLWQASQLTVSLVHANANVLVGLLGHPHQRNTIIADVMACAQAGQARLQCHTNLQAQTMLSIPAVALAYNVAMDCEAEFDNEEGLARWSKKARDLDCGNGNSER